MTALLPHHIPDTISLAAPTIADRPLATDPNIVGTRCDQHRKTSYLTDAPHTGCPGWWGRHINDENALTCACACHEETYGWPHWEEALERFRGH